MTQASRTLTCVFTGVMIAGLGAPDRGAAQHDHAHHDDPGMSVPGDIGTVDFRVGCDASVQADFDHALGLMHHMMYAQAREAFGTIIEAQPDCAMAHWGIATTLFQPLWGTRPTPEDLQLGLGRIERAAALGVTDEREQHLLDATAAFFRGGDETAFGERLAGWQEGMAAAYASHPEDPDITSLYALALLSMAQAPGKDRDRLHDWAEVLLRQVWERIPEHPGAIHYSIHATDADGRAHNALDLVEHYATIAPEVPHALHMPSHIYVRLGDWPQVIEWNERSARAALAQSPPEAISHHYIHAIDYLVYAHLQRGEDRQAATLAEDALTAGPHQQSFISAFHHAAIPARLAVEQRDWQRAMAIEPRSPRELPWDEATWAEGLSWYAKGLGAVHAGDLGLARTAEQRLGELAGRARDRGEEAFATYLEVDRHILDGWLHLAENRKDEAVAQMRSAVALERTAEKHPVTPGALLPPNEALGDLLLELDRPQEAMAAYRQADTVWPGRFNTLLGAARAAEAVGDLPRSRGYYARLLALAGDSRREGVEEARQLLGQRAPEY